MKAFKPCGHHADLICGCGILTGAEMRRLLAQNDQLPEERDALEYDLSQAPLDHEALDGPQ